MCQMCVGSFFGGHAGLSALKAPASMSRRQFLAKAAGASVMLPLAACSGGALQAPGADVIFRGGPIIPMAGTDPAMGPVYAEAIAVSGNQIIAVGSEDFVSETKTASTQVIDLAGRALLPGFIDPHQHTLTGSLIKSIFTYCGYSPMPPSSPGYRTYQDVIDFITKQAASAKPGGPWLLYYSYDNLLQGSGLNGGTGNLLMTNLDQISTSIPILVYYINMHTASANSAAFAAVGINPSESVASINAELYSKGGGHLGYNADGTPNGMIYESPAIALFSKGMPFPSPEVSGAAVYDWLLNNASLGNTCVHEPGVILPTSDGGNLLLDYMYLASISACRASVSFMAASGMGYADPYKKYGYGAKATLIPNTLFSIYGMKIVGDGSNQTETAAQRSPYLDGTNGTPNYTPDALNALVATVQAAGWPVLIHCNGSATIDDALDAIEAAYGPNPPTGINRIEHSTMATPDQLDRMARLGVQPSFFMNHVYLYGAAYRDTLFGPERTAQMDPAAGCISRGIPFTLHSDAPCSPIGPLQLVQTAVTRQCAIDGSIIGPNEAVSLTNALRGITIHAAAQIGLAEQLGTLEAGKLADFTILEQDPYTVDPGKIMDIKVSQTWVNGKKKFGI